jgi:hypothetical protein
LLGPILAVGVWARGFAVGVIVALGLFLAFFLLRVILRRTWLAVATVILMVVIPIGLAPAPGSSIPWVTMAVWGILTGVSVFNLLCFGVLTVVVSFVFSAEILRQTAFGTDLSAWYAPTMYLAAGIVVALALWSFRHALAGRRVLTGTLLED